MKYVETYEMALAAYKAQLRLSSKVYRRAKGYDWLVTDAGHVLARTLLYTFENIMIAVSDDVYKKPWYVFINGSLWVGTSNNPRRYGTFDAALNAVLKRNKDNDN